MKILVVEDDIDTRELVGTLLEMHGYETLAAGDAQDALQLINHSSDIDVMVTDVSLPGLSGLELAGMASTIRPALGIIVCSGYGEQQFDTLPCRVEWIQKPIQMDPFLKAVARFSKEG